MTDTTTTGTATTTTEGVPASPANATAAPSGAAAAAAIPPADGAQAQQGGQDAPPAASSESKGADAPVKAGAPETYEFTAPEGRAFDAEVITSFSAIAKELDLPQEAAQKMLNAVGPKIAERQAATLDAARMQWAESARADKEFGGDQLESNLAVAKKAVDAFGSPELRTLLNETGLGNHPELIRMMYRAGKSISEDKFVGGVRGGQKSGPKNFNDLASALYSS